MSPGAMVGGLLVVIISPYARKGGIKEKFSAICGCAKLPPSHLDTWQEIRDKWCRYPGLRNLQSRHLSEVPVRLLLDRRFTKEFPELDRALSALRAEGYVDRVIETYQLGPH
jgi:hypothetical protein